MRKIIRRYGSMLVISFKDEEREAYGLKKGDIVEITITKVEEEK